MLKLYLESEGQTSLHACMSQKPFVFNGVVEFLFIIAVYLRIKDYSGMNIKNSTMLHTVMFNVFSNGNQSDNI